MLILLVLRSVLKELLLYKYSILSRLILFLVIKILLVNIVLVIFYSFLVALRPSHYKDKLIKFRILY